MKQYLLLPVLAVGLILLCACGGKEPAQPETVIEPIEPAGDPLEITSFSFYHTASWAGDCYCLELTREEADTHLYAEALVSGGDIVDVRTEESLLERLGEMLGKYHVERWDGFDENNRNVLDGSSFTLSITLADGSTISAHGNNAFPEYYSEVYTEIRAMYTEVMERYAEEDT